MTRTRRGVFATLSAGLLLVAPVSLVLAATSPEPLQIEATLEAARDEVLEELAHLQDDCLVWLVSESLARLPLLQPRPAPEDTVAYQRLVQITTGFHPFEPTPPAIRSWIQMRRAEHRITRQRRRIERAIDLLADEPVQP